jgi:hypothetical protein
MQMPQPSSFPTTSAAFTPRPATGEPVPGLDDALSKSYSALGGSGAASSGSGGGLMNIMSSLGVAPDVASGAIEYMRRNESGLDPNAVNPTSGALGIAQWLGPRKAALTSRFGARPTVDQQENFIGDELLGPESGTLDALRNAKTAKEGYDIWGRNFERPGGAALAKAGVGGIMGAAADASKAAIGLRTSVDPMEMGRMQIPQLAKRIDELYPGLDPVVKGMALQFSAKMLAPDQAATLRAWMQENNANFRVAIAEFQAKEREKAAETRASTSGTRLLETPKGLVEWHPGQPIPEGASVSKGGTASNALEMSKTLEVLNDKGEVVRTLLARESRNKAGWVDSATGKPIELKSGETLKQVTPTTSGGGRAGAQVLRQQIGGREVLSDLQNAVSMPVGSTIGWLGTYQPGTSMTGVLGGDLARQLTTQDAQLMQASFASLSRELSILMSPVYGGNWAAQQIDPLIPKSGDTMGTVLFKISRIAQSADNALEALEKAPVLSNDQKSFAKDLRKQILEAVPWTPNEAMSFARGADKGEKDESFADFMKRKPGGKEPAAAKGATAGAPKEGDIATAPGQPDLVYRGGKWVPAQ